MGKVGKRNILGVKECTKKEFSAVGDSVSKKKKVAALRSRVR